MATEGFTPSQDMLHRAALAAIPKLKLVADELAEAADAKRLRYKDKGEVLRSSGERPKYDRPLERVTYTNGAQEHGTSRARRLRILGGSVLAITGRQKGGDA